MPPTPEITLRESIEEYKAAIKEIAKLTAEIESSELFIAKEKAIQELSEKIENSKAFIDRKLQEAHLSQMRETIDSLLENGTKIISENWKFNKGNIGTRKTVDVKKIKDLYTDLKAGDVLILDKEGDHSDYEYSDFYIVKETPARLTITAPTKKELEKGEKNV